MGHGAAQEADAEESREFGPLAPDWDSWTAKGVEKAVAGGTNPLP